MQKFYADLKKNGRQSKVELYGKGLSDRMVRSCHTTCRSALQKAVDEKLITVNPADGCKLPPKKAQEMQVLTHEEMKRFLMQSKQNDFYELALLELATGMRRGEICALTMSDIDGDFVNVSRAVVRDPLGEWVTKEPKTASSIRRVLLPHFVVERIRERGHITHLLPNQVSDKFWKKQLRLGISRPYCFHSLRHFHASYLHALNIPDAYIMARGGWSSPAVMQSVYRHALTDHVSVTDLFAVSAFQNPFQDNPATQ